MIKVAFRTARLCILPLLATVLATAPAAATNLVSNGNFSQTTLTGSYPEARTTSFGFGSWNQPRVNGQETGLNNQVNGWSTDGYSFLFTPGTADVGGHGATGDHGGAIGHEDRVWLWGPDGSGDSPDGNGLPVSPAGGNFVGANGQYMARPISQLVSGLQAGQDYTIRFWWAAAQQRGYNGDQIENWTVTLGNQSFVTETIANADHGFSGWRLAEHRFTATDSSSLLSFTAFGRGVQMMADGTPQGVPPFLLLDGVQLFQSGAVPEPATWGMFLAGFGALGIMARRRRRVAAAA